MILFIGLGNPTPDSHNNRHNIGFKVIDAINKKFTLSKQKLKFKGLLTTGNIANKKMVDFLDSKIPKIGQHRTLRFSVITSIDNDDRSADRHQVCITL